MITGEKRVKDNTTQKQASKGHRREFFLQNLLCCGCKWKINVRCWETFTGRKSCNGTCDVIYWLTARTTEWGSVTTRHIRVMTRLPEQKAWVVRKRRTSQHRSNNIVRMTSRRNDQTVVGKWQCCDEDATVKLQKDQTHTLRRANATSIFVQFATLILSSFTKIFV